MSARDFEDDMLFTSPSLGQEPAFDVDLLRVISAARSAVTAHDNRAGHAEAITALSAALDQFEPWLEVDNDISVTRWCNP